MPLVQVSCDVAIHYQVSYSNDDPSQARQQPWLMIIHPIIMDSSYLKSFAEDPEIQRSFNRVLFDLRHHGRSLGVPLRASDCFTMAADLAIGLENLGIPAVHAIATHVFASEILLRLAALFPAKVLSLCLSSPLPPSFEPRFGTAFQECLEWCLNPNSVEEWDESVSAIQWFNFGDPSFIDQDHLDEWAAVVLKRIPPSRAVDCFLLVLPFIGVTSTPPSDYLSEDLRAAITHPILVLHGGHDVIFTRAGCESRLDQLPRHEHTQVKTIENAPLLLFKTHVEEARTHFLEWIREILAGRFDDYAHVRERTDWKASLAKLGRHCKDEAVGARDPMESSSYHCQTKERLEFAEGIVEELKVKQLKAWSLFGGGAPELWMGASFQDTVPWRFSRRFDDARLVASSPVLTRSKCDNKPKVISIQTLVEVQDQVELGI